MKNSEMAALHEDLINLKGLKGVKFNYAVAKNINLLRPEVEALKKAIEMPQDYQETFEKERLALAESLALKDGTTGKGIIVKGQYQFNPTSGEKFQKELANLKIKYKKVWAAREVQEKEFEKLLEKTMKIELVKVSIEELPEDMTTEQVVSLFPMISEEKPRLKK